MVNFFRKIRRKLADANKPIKYARYAFGEIILVVIGILIALQVNNLNEERKQKEDFKIYVEQVYSLLHEDLVTMKTLKAKFELENKVIDSLITVPEAFDKKRLPALLFFIGWGKSDPNDFVTANSLPNFEISLDNNIQKSLQLRIKRFIFQISKQREIDDLILSKYLTEVHNIPIPTLSMYSNVMFRINNDFGYYSDEEIANVVDLVKAKEVRRMLKNVYVVKEIMVEELGYHIQIAQGIINSIVVNYPDIRLIINEVEILGSACEFGWKNSEQLNNDIKKDNVWFIKLHLKEGEVKFRTHNNWSQNWGGNSFPEGDAIWHGQTIQVDKAGLYNITLDLNNNSYKFELIEHTQ